MRGYLSKMALALVAASALTGTALNAQWTQTLKSGGIAYFLFTNTLPHLERYELGTGQWLPALSLPSVYGAPTVFHVDADGLYVAYGNAIKRYTLSGESEQHLINTTSAPQSIFSDGDLLLINCSAGLYPKFTSMRKSTGAVIAEYESYLDTVSGAAIAASINKIFGRSAGVSPSDITYASYTDAGTFSAIGESPYHGDYPGANKVWIFPGETRVVDDSGTVYSTGNLNYLNSLGGSISDLDFWGADIPIVLRANTLVAYSNTLLPAGSRTLAYTPKNIYVSGSNVLAFTPALTASNGVQVEAIPLSTLNAPTPGQPINPNDLAFTPDNAFVDKYGVLFLLSKSQQSLFRWDPTSQMYLTTIPLLGSPSYVTYSANLHKVYLAYSTGLIRQIDLSSPTLTETPFTTLPSSAMGLAVAGAYLFAVDGSGAWDTHYTFNSAGTLVSSRDWNYYSSEYVWSDVNQKMYFFRDDTSPNDVLMESINASGTAYPELGPGAIGAEVDSPLHESYGWNHPIRVSPDGSTVVLGSGLMHSATNLARLATALANSFTDGAWVGSQFRTMRTISNLTQFQQWNGSFYAQGVVRQVPGTAWRCFSLSGNQLLAIVLLDGKPAYYLLDDDFHISAPAVLAPPGRLQATVVSPSQINLAWQDVTGEEGYAIERWVSGSSNWVAIGAAAASVTAFPDGAVSQGNTYLYRVTATNGALSSAPSCEVAVNFVSPPSPTNVNAAPLSTSVIRLVWDDTENESGYLLERRTGLSGAWASLAAVAANSTGYTNSGLSANTEYYYRLRATNGVGTSDYSVAVSAITLPIIPTIPTLNSATATGPFLVQLAWSNSSYEDNFVIERRLSGTNEWTVLAMASRDVTSYADRSVLPLTSYEYRVYATNRAGASGLSGVKTAATPQIPPPDAPAGLLARALSLSAVMVSWLDVSTESGYQLERRDENPDSWIVIALLASNACVFVDTNLVPGTQYFYRVRATNEYGASLSSNLADATPDNIMHLLEEHFDPQLDAAVWAAVAGGVVTNQGAGFPGSQVLWFGAAGSRQAVTMPVDVSRGGYLEFKLRAGNEAVDGNGFWNNSENGETVALEYSTDNGFQWALMQSLNSVYPALSNWTSFSISIPAAAASAHTQFRWRQLANSGAGFDTWALDDLCIQAPAPVPPSPPPFIISSPSSATSIAVFWVAAERVSHYRIERRQGTNAWLVLRTVPAASNYYTDDAVAPGTGYSYRVQSVNASGASAYSPITKSITWGLMEEWLMNNYGCADGLTNGLFAVAADGSVQPLLRYAFNLSADEPAKKHSPGLSTNGLPAIWFDAARNRLTVEFVRRKASLNPGVQYRVQFSDNLFHWSAAESGLFTNELDLVWERVRFEDQPDTSTNQIRFGRVVVEKP